MEQPNVGSTNATPSNPSGSLTPVVLPESEAVAAKRSLRRKLLIGGAVTGGLFTLPNSAVLAQKKKQKCTVSALMSQNGSKAIQTPCGDSPGCWRNNAFSTWADGATFTVNKVKENVTPTHSTTFQTYQSSGGVTF